MKTCLFILMFAFGAATFVSAGTGFDDLKSLAGKWIGEDQNGNPLRVDYKVVSGGNALFESMSSGEQPEMVTMYYPDRDEIMLSHFCLLKNQVRMKTTKVDPHTFEFHFVDATNLVNPSQPHMTKLLLRREDENRTVQVWTHLENGKESTTVFHLNRWIELNTIGEELSCLLLTRTQPGSQIVCPP